MCIYICIYIYIHTHTHTYTQGGVCVCVCVYTKHFFSCGTASQLRLRVPHCWGFCITQLNTQLLSHNWTHTISHTHTHTHTHIHTHINTNTHTHKHTHTHTHTVGLLWTSYQLIAQATVYRTHKKHKNEHACPKRESNPRSEQSSFLPHGHCDWEKNIFVYTKYIIFMLATSQLTG